MNFIFILLSNKGKLKYVYSGMAWMTFCSIAASPIFKHRSQMSRAVFLKKSKKLSKSKEQLQTTLYLDAVFVIFFF